MFYNDCCCFKENVFSIQVGELKREVICHKHCTVPLTLGLKLTLLVPGTLRNAGSRARTFTFRQLKRSKVSCF